MKYQLNSEKILFSQLGNEGAVYDMETNAYISINETLFKILKGIENGLSSNEIIQQLCKEYSVSEEQCTLEVKKAIEQLIGKKYIL